MLDVTLLLLLLATVWNGILAGASLDQSIKQLPARRRIGITAYSNYNRASDLAQGIVWYAILGLGAALLALASAAALLLRSIGLEHAFPIYLAGALSILHSLVTTRAAPLLFRQRQVNGDETALTAIFDRFARWQALRAFLQSAAFLSLVWGLVRYLQ